MDYRLRIGSQIFGVAGIALLAFFALCPADWFPHTVLNFGLDHFLAFFVVTSILIVGWSRPFLLGAVAAAVGILLEGLQFLTPDRTPQLMGAFYSALGALAAALVAEYVIREGKDEQSQ
jgi:methyl coenzyme M reductase beta subunit